MWLTELENKYSKEILEKFLEFSKGMAHIADETFGGDLYYSERTIKAFEQKENLPNSERAFPI